METYLYFFQLWVCIFGVSLEIYDKLVERDNIVEKTSAGILWQGENYGMGFSENGIPWVLLQYFSYTGDLEKYQW